MSTQKFVSYGLYRQMAQRGLARALRLQAVRHCAVRTTATAPAAARMLHSTAFTATAAAAAASSSAPVLPSSVSQTPCGLYVDRSLPSNFTKVLIANRGEIACRVIRTCRALGVKTVAVYSDADRHAQHVQMADEAYRIGEAPAAQSYLLGDRILDIARRSGAQAIHPGYGFLSENAKFARLCEAAGIEFIGPPASAIESMGSKSASKQIMIAAGVPVVPGYHGEDQSPERLQAEADKCGYPLMLKAVLGGGGKGMRIVHSAAEFSESLDACKREALKSFGDERVLLERYIVRPRHIEFQVFADKSGDAVHLCERDCSVQRRHQKVLEEAPAPGMSPELRAEMGQSAVNAAKAVGYVGAGTVEFIFDADTNNYFFMEMNTRLQVEHPVTEMITRTDLVQWQLHVAAGHTLPMKQAAIVHHGHAIEARVYAENPRNNFLPATGRLVHLTPPTASPTLRVESGVREGDEVSIFYDPMIAKLCVWGRDRAAALDAIAEGLRRYQIVGPPTNLAFLSASIAHPAFRAGQVETGFIAENMKDLLPLDVSETEVTAEANRVSAAFALLHLLQAERATVAERAASSAVPASPWFDNASRRLNHAHARVVDLLREQSTDNEGGVADESVRVEVTTVDTTGPAEFQLRFGEVVVPVTVSRTASSASGSLTATIGGRAFHSTVVRVGRNVHVFVDGAMTKYRLPEPNFSVGEVGATGCQAPMAGKVVKVHVQKGDAVVKGQPLVIMEAMKMEHVLRAPVAGVVSEVLFQAGDFVEGGRPVVTFADAADKA